MRLPWQLDSQRCMKDVVGVYSLFELLQSCVLLFTIVVHLSDLILANICIPKGTPENPLFLIAAEVLVNHTLHLSL